MSDIEDKTEELKALELQEKIKSEIDKIRANGEDVYLTIQAIDRLDMLIGVLNEVGRDQKTIIRLLSQLVEDKDIPGSPSESLMN